MPIAKYAFHPQIETHHKTSKLIGIVFQPKIPVFLKIKGKFYPNRIVAHLDSGATRNLFPAEILNSLGIKLKNGNERIHFGIGGRLVTSYTHEVEMLFEKYSFITEVDFSAEHRPPLLGVEGFFKFFDYVNFNMINKQVDLKYSL